MNREDRARQFMPFDALKGLREELLAREREALRAPRRELFEEEAALLSNALSSLSVGKRIEVEFYDSGYYRVVEGVVLALDSVYSRLVLSVSCEKRVIALCDVYRICEK